MVLLGFLFWLVMKIAPERDGKGKSSKPSHFTIPILSPFTSVVRCLLFLVPVRHCDLRGVGGAREWRPWSQDGCYFGLGHGYRSVRCVETSAFTVAHGINLETLLQPVFVTCWTRSSLCLLQGRVGRFWKNLPQSHQLRRWPGSVFVLGQGRR